MYYHIKVGKNPVSGEELYVTARLHDGQWTAPSAHHDGLKTYGPRGPKGLHYVLSAALRTPASQMWEEDKERAITVEEAERL